MFDILKFLGENVGAVDVVGSVLYMDLEILLLAFMENNSWRLRCLRPFIVVFFSRRVQGCRCRRRWVRQYLSCPDRLFGS